MNAEHTDVRLFRRRAFELDWIERLREELGGEASDPDILMSLLEWNDPARTLSLVLLIEAQEWLELGGRVGYFAAGREHASHEAVASIVWETFAAFVPCPLTTASFSELDFVVALTQSIEDLNDDRRDFLSLVYFAGDEEWGERLGELRDVAVAIQRQPELSLPAESVDRIAWALEGAVSDVRRRPFTPLPSDWRVDSSRAFEWASHTRERQEQRLVELTDARDALWEATGWLPEQSGQRVQLDG